MTKQDNKDKLRVYEYAKSLNMSSKEIITILKRLDLPVNNHMSVMENEMVSRVEGFFRNIKENAAAKRAQEGSGAGRQQAAGKPSGDRPQAAARSNEPQASLRSNTLQSGERPAQGQQSGGQRPNDQVNRINPNQTEKQETMNSTTTTTNTQPQNNANRQQGGSNGRPQGQSGQAQQGGGYNRPQGGGRPQGQGGQGQQGGGYNRPQGQGGQNRGAQGGGQGGQNRGPQGGNRPAGQGGQGGFRSGQAQGGGQGGQGGNRPVGAGQGGFRSGGPGGAGVSQGGARPQQNRFNDSKPGSGRPGEGGDSSRNRNNNNRSKPGGGRFDDNRNYKGGRGGKNNRGGRGNQNQERREKIDNTPKKVIVRGSMTVGELAKLLHKDASEVIKKLLLMGVMATINQELDLDTIQLVIGDYGVEAEIKLPVDEDSFETVEENDEDADLETRPPVVTIMGHVDHGKTTLLDAIRETNVTGGEAGGITQHIGAYQAEINQKKITFLDTPGHEAFTTMRARGAQVTDITILVVAADDGVMPQTIEAINHAKAAGVPIIVAVNKIDKEGANPDKIMQALTEYELVPEAWGGETIFVNISAKQRMNLEELLEMILLVAEVNDYKANPNKRARGTVIEAELDKGKGPVARVLVQHGTLKIGDAFVAGNCFGRIRAMVNDKGRRMKEAGPSTPVEITGLTEVPLAGDPFMVFEDERKARAIADRRAIKQRESERGSNSRVTLDDLYKHIKDGEIKDLNVIIKSDVQGSAEALKGSLAKIEIEGVRVKILHSGVGAITESDVTLASASNAIVIGFNVRPEPQAKQNADQEKVDIRLHSIIYKVIDEIEHAMKGMLDPVYKEVVIGHAEVRNLFKVSKVGTIAGCMVTSGKITRSAKARLIRGGIVVFEGEIESLKRYKDDAKEVAQGYECGITLDGYNDLQEGDTIEAFIMETVER
ncbi:translation initiation factor IF-2 [Paenibacillus darwinianus]|uniref:Translation initiation factor IF-2 n=1 Tax=Paenibacillus darwinianus TaxID=1380763 RepID=A0A9W5S347_9BACL|nr:translation initiation factor IF-2 [Paenibacillus darwinianus]EXX91209.1 translation initiation factor IF-2 [Paenibacillus darwinianus]EXX92138.1 translation initiation factor IF-2 [Paenibacillus darwinianus]EXX92789.1 translation initiation factor IF-2 [Paenibacillus darwinianus]